MIMVLVWCKDVAHKHTNKQTHTHTHTYTHTHTRQLEALKIQTDVILRASV
jgi:hypothetical protein